MVNLTKTYSITKQYLKKYKYLIIILAASTLASVLYDLLDPSQFESTLLIGSVLTLTCVIPAIKAYYPVSYKPISFQKWGSTMFVSILIFYQVLAWQIRENTDITNYADIMKYLYILWVVIAVFGAFMIHGYSREIAIPYHVNLLTLAGIILSLIELSFLNTVIWVLVYFLFVDAGRVVPFLIFIPLKKDY